MLNVQRLRVFREVLARASFSGAAEALGYTQSAVSQAVATLEAETGATLIVRDRRGLRPTAAGEALAEHTDGILARIEAAQDALRAVAGLREGRLRIASFPTAGATLMPLAIAAFRSNHPEIELSLIEGEPEDIAPRLRAGEIDLALLFDFRGVAESVGSGVRTVQLVDDPMHVALPAGHPLAAKKSLRLEALSGEAWVQTSAASPCARHVVRCCHAAGFEPVVSFESDDYLTVQGLVAAGVGVALIPELALSSVRDDIVIRKLSPRSPMRRVVAATPGTPGAWPAAREMVRILVDTARRYTGASASGGMPAGSGGRYGPKYEIPPA
jgi:DNA-binding transcriptional LysR family regulator